MAVPVTALTRRDIPVPVFAATIRNIISSVERGALGIINLQITHARPRDVNVARAEPDKESSSSIYIRSGNRQDVIT